MAVKKKIKAKKKIKKKPPPKVKSPVVDKKKNVTEFGKEAKPLVAKIEVADKEDIPEGLWLRRYAKIYYTTHEKGITVE